MICSIDQLNTMRIYVDKELNVSKLLKVIQLNDFVSSFGLIYDQFNTKMFYDQKEVSNDSFLLAMNRQFHLLKINLLSGKQSLYPTEFSFQQESRILCILPE